jgi:hypothetical protein
MMEPRTANPRDRRVHGTPSRDPERTRGHSANRQRRVRSGRPAVRRRRRARTAVGLPYRVRYLLAWDHDLCRAVVGVTMCAVLGWLRNRARLDGLTDGRGGAVAIIQRSEARSISTCTFTRSCARGSATMPAGRMRGGRAPRWSRDGREIFYIASNRMMSVTPLGTPSLARCRGGGSAKADRSASTDCLHLKGPASRRACVFRSGDVSQSPRRVGSGHLPAHARRQTDRPRSRCGARYRRTRPRQCASARWRTGRCHTSRRPGPAAR